MPTFSFDPTGSVDSPCNAHFMASAARAAYAATSELAPILLESWGLEDFHEFETSTTQGYIANGNGVTVLAFRGSDHTELDDWIGNADFDLVFDPDIRGGQIHSGFQRSSSAIWPIVNELLTKHRPPSNQLVLTGHSLGGALAILTAARFASEQRATEIDGIFTYGQPRAGDSEFTTQFDRDFKDRTFRYVNRFDLVTRLPPRLLGYDHAGQLRYIDENGQLHKSLSLWQQLLLTLNPAGKTAQDYINELTKKLPGAVNDHNGGRYVELLQALCAK